MRALSPKKLCSRAPFSVGGLISFRRKCPAGHPVGPVARGARVCVHAYVAACGGGSNRIAPRDGHPQVSLFNNGEHASTCVQYVNSGDVDHVGGRGRSHKEVYLRIVFCSTFSPTLFSWSPTCLSGGGDTQLLAHSCYMSRRCMWVGESYGCLPSALFFSRGPSFWLERER